MGFAEYGQAFTELEFLYTDFTEDTEKILRLRKKQKPKKSVWSAFFRVQKISKIMEKDG